MIRTMLSAALVLMPLAAGAQAPPPVTPGTPYEQARRALLADGWQPLRDPDADRCSQTDRRCAGRPEMLACSGTGAANCLFGWQRGGTTIEVITEGEDTVVTGLRRRR
ncbi:hypothetical protein [Roseomonas rosulenta]|uniref:hypothetical protein n=1 Tax=Roseomonas rosulenta TaxID=2748667 RepID=UPI0018E046CB|nr:hypothetical protein [Roseomonas rosulenta]